MIIIFLVLIIIIISLGTSQKRELDKIHYSKISFPPCRPYRWEYDKNGMVKACMYYDKKGRKRFCCNPHHNHCY